MCFNAKITTLDRQNPVAQAVAIRDGHFLAVGSEQEARDAAPDATVIDAGGHRPADEDGPRPVGTEVLVGRGAMPVVVGMEPAMRLSASTVMKR